VELLRDATENYPAWLNAIERAHRSIMLESYILSWCLAPAISAS